MPTQRVIVRIHNSEGHTRDSGRVALRKPSISVSIRVMVTPDPDHLGLPEGTWGRGGGPPSPGWSFPSLAADPFLMRWVIWR